MLCRKCSSHFKRWLQRGQYFLFSVVFIPSPTNSHGSVCVRSHMYRQMPPPPINVNHLIFTMGLNVNVRVDILILFDKETRKNSFSIFNPWGIIRRATCRLWLSGSRHAFLQPHCYADINRARICKPRNRFPTWRNRFPTWRNRFLGSLNVYKYGLSTVESRVRWVGAAILP